VYAFLRRPKKAEAPEVDHVVVVANLSPVVKRDYLVGVPYLGAYREVLSTDAADFGGSGVVNPALVSEEKKSDGQEATLKLTLPPLGVVFLKPDPATADEVGIGSPS
jgi:1,4-alpha-glucan branching enzyme